MKVVEIIGYKRANLGKTEAKQLRAEGLAPCVLYGGKEQVHFYSPMILFRDLVYNPDAAYVKLNIEGDEYDAILQDAQFHPTNEVLLHADFLLLRNDKFIKMNIPIKLVGNSVGVQKGGKLITKLRKLTILALPTDMPEFVEVDITNLEVGKSFKVKDLGEKNYKILNSPSNPIVSVEVTRALRQAEQEAAKEAKGTKKK
ncbi:MAG: 50S ribosomal protein L25/general stress protein Ctc [Thermonemataceae bacterium]|nr:50S ribosomal protein L25/general stress protein Ctc [Thermonemataceae bacterium]